MSKVLHERRAGCALFFLGATEALPKFGWTNQARDLFVQSRRPIQTICISYGMRIRVSLEAEMRCKIAYANEMFRPGRQILVAPGHIFPQLDRSFQTRSGWFAESMHTLDLSMKREFGGVGRTLQLKKVRHKKRPVQRPISSRGVRPARQIGKSS